MCEGASRLVAKAPKKPANRRAAVFLAPRLLPLFSSVIRKFPRLLPQQHQRPRKVFVGNLDCAAREHSGRRLSEVDAMPAQEVHDLVVLSRFQIAQLDEVPHRAI